jgi:hypothetical protein
MNRDLLGINNRILTTTYRFLMTSSLALKKEKQITLCTSPLQNVFICLYSTQLHTKHVPQVVPLRMDFTIVFFFFHFAGILLLFSSPLVPPQRRMGANREVSANIQHRSSEARLVPSMAAAAL